MACNSNAPGWQRFAVLKTTSIKSTCSRLLLAGGNAVALTSTTSLIWTLLLVLIRLFLISGVTRATILHWFLKPLQLRRSSAEKFWGTSTKQIQN
ncbi:hypothetical protein OEZ85_002233 [Tetradesmus obliquus]|uniref:Uncharacterized protein n=1 Tax=Tetradesmus obliquus TaxID=3088 RepID=A0ABY8U579_TETOB|nr:hypothetical protein OEZ85_002233 [Tetradesmus obliquus]